LEQLQATGKPWFGKHKTTFEPASVRDSKAEKPSSVRNAESQRNTPPSKALRKQPVTCDDVPLVSHQL